MLHVKEASAGHERLKVVLKAFEQPVEPPAFGNPVFGASAYDVCVYDATDALAGALRIDRAQDVCGNRGRSCWRRMPSGALKYVDPELRAHGARRFMMRNGSVGGGQIVLVAKNAVQRGRVAMPTGIAAALVGNARATVQVVVSDGACFALDAGDVRAAQPAVFRALAE